MNLLERQISKTIKESILVDAARIEDMTAECICDDVVAKAAIRERKNDSQERFSQKCFELVLIFMISLLILTGIIMWIKGIIMWIKEPDKKSDITFALGLDGKGVQGKRMTFGPPPGVRKK